MTNFLSAVVSTTEVLTFQQAQNQSALCSSIRNPSTVDNATSTSCPYGAGEIALGVEIPLEGSFGLTTITTHLTVLDPSVPPVQLACYMISVTPYYPSYFPYKILHYLPIFLLASYLLIYVISRFWAAHSDFVHENETHLASSLTLKLSVMDSLGDPWKMVIYSAWAGKQLVGSGSLRRFSTLELREVWNTLAWFSIVGMVAVNWTSFACESS